MQELHSVWLNVAGKRALKYATQCEVGVLTSLSSVILDFQWGRMRNVLKLLFFHLPLCHGVCLVHLNLLSARVKKQAGLYPLQNIFVCRPQGFVRWEIAAMLPAASSSILAQCCSFKVLGTVGWHQTQSCEIEVNTIAVWGSCRKRRS